MLGSDAHDILQLQQQKAASGGTFERPAAVDEQQQMQPKETTKKSSRGRPPPDQDDVFKRPEGMHRELYNLLVHQGKDGGANSLCGTDTRRGYTTARPLLTRKVRRWHWRPFVNQGRTDGLQLCHWERERNDPSPPEYPFARFNKTVEPVAFSDFEYAEYLQDARWSMEETRRLLELCHRYSLEWDIVMDRFVDWWREQSQSEGQSEENLGQGEGEVFVPRRKKSMEDAKERYYWIVNTLNAARQTPGFTPLYFDADSERRRKEQLQKLWDRTEEQIKEEDELRAEIKRIEARKKERERKAHEVQRLINSTEHVKLNQGETIYLGGSGGRLRKTFKTRGGQQNVIQLISDANIRWPTFTTPGVHMRSQEMRVPNNISKLKMKNLETVLDRLKLDLYPNAFEDVIQAFNRFRANIVILQELKTALGAAESDIDQLVERAKVEKGMTLHVDLRLRVSDAFYNRSATDSEDGGEQKGPPLTPGLDGPAPPQTPGAKKRIAPVTARRIAQWIDIQPLVATATRKRRSGATGANEATPSTTSEGVGGGSSETAVEVKEEEVGEGEHNEGGDAEKGDEESAAAAIFFE